MSVPILSLWSIDPIICKPPFLFVLTEDGSSFPPKCCGKGFLLVSIINDVIKMDYFDYDS